jgi:antitoxin component of MazEF toxin-antitoxin module
MPAGTRHDMEADMAAFRGRIVSGGWLQIPAEVCSELGLADGADVRLEVIDGELRVRSLRAALARVRAAVREYDPEDVSLVNELIADRRAAADE